MACSFCKNETDHQEGCPGGVKEGREQDRLLQEFVDGQTSRQIGLPKKEGGSSAYRLGYANP